MNLVIPYVFRNKHTGVLTAGRTLESVIGDADKSEWEVVTTLPKNKRFMFQPDGSLYPETAFNVEVRRRADSPGYVTIVIGRYPRLVRVYVADGSRVIFDGGDACV